MSSQVSVPTPSSIPPDYRFAERVNGGQCFGRGPNQLSLFYRRSTQSDDYHYPIVVYIAPPASTELSATEGGPSQSVDLNLPGVTAVYHDGMWAPGPGANVQDLGGQTLIHWETLNGFHSITAYGPNNTFAVRGPKNRGVAFADLLNIAKSLFS